MGMGLAAHVPGAACTFREADAAFRRAGGTPDPGASSQLVFHGPEDALTLTENRAAGDSGDQHCGLAGADGEGHYRGLRRGTQPWRILGQRRGGYARLPGRRGHRTRARPIDAVGGAGGRGRDGRHPRRRHDPGGAGLRGDSRGGGGQPRQHQRARADRHRGPRRRGAARLRTCQGTGCAQGHPAAGQRPVPLCTDAARGRRAGAPSSRAPHLRSAHSDRGQRRRPTQDRCALGDRRARAAGVSSGAVAGVRGAARRARRAPVHRSRPGHGAERHGEAHRQGRDGRELRHARGPRRR